MALYQYYLQILNITKLDYCSIYFKTIGFYKENSFCSTLPLALMNTYSNNSYSEIHSMFSPTYFLTYNVLKSITF